MSWPSFDCPRRADQHLLWGRVTGEQLADYIDSALDPVGHPVLDDDGQPIRPQDHWRHDGTCSYCGSISPDRLFAALDAGAELGPTDKNYKVYVSGHGKFYTVHLNREHAARLRALLLDGKVPIGYPGHFYNGLWLAQPRPEG